ncbi:unnamed protein product [Psylliodes chrysocephalus]|uniref:G-protein coupled receptors family 2 profile 1 domain-containing protein n=1 Tax=Psylliodes chrysocephalus TaxID=3402493 RepID=A0A9P0G8G6_9CUCU|nr:unnamed protein product [Psylliodes chrysocephala]
MFKNENDVITYLRKKCYNRCKEQEILQYDTCDTIFEELLCWPTTKAGSFATQNCSGDFLKSTLKGTVERQCTENGTWSPIEEPINYTCGTFFINFTQEDLPEVSLYKIWLPIMKDISYCGYSLSIISLILSISILVNIKRLHCSRNKLHINLFVSFILRSLMSILKDCTFIRGTAFAHDTVYDINGEPSFPLDLNYSWICKAFISIRYYVILSNFMLMLMEGMYLHNLMFLKLFSDHHGVVIYCVLGWGLPLIFVIPWIILRVLFENVLCWTTKKNSYIALFIDIPIGITVVINFILFLTIVRVLRVKLNNACFQQKKIKYGKLLKATMILIPLFGVPYAFSLLMSIYVKKSVVLELIFLFFDQSFAAFQGLFAALVYCLFNSEVQMELRRKYVLMKVKNDKEFRRSRTISNTQQVSFQMNDDFPSETICMTTKGNNNPEIIVDKEHQCYF